LWSLALGTLEVVGFFVDVHSHVVPSGDDGAQSVGEGRTLAAQAAAHGTALLFATPHVWPHLTLTDERERAVRSAYEEVADRAALDLRLGWELTPAPPLLEQDLGRYELPGTGAVLIEIPFSGTAELFFEVADRASAQGLRVVVAHPERTEAVLEDPSVALRAAERGWLLQVNATSLLGRHGAEIESLAWRFVDESLVALIASDGHRLTRPPFLDAAYDHVAVRVGETRARSLFDGSALDLAVTGPRRLPSRAGARGG
jgi:protein-tyrosine phosphatase